MRIQTQGKARVNLMLYYNPSEKSIEFAYPWLWPVCAKLVCRERPSECEFLFNKNYLRFSEIVAEGWELVDVLRSMLQIFLIGKGMYMIHAAAVRIGEKGVLVPSFGNTGKTTTSWMLARRGADFLTDEFAILDSDGVCFGFPCSSLISSGLVSATGLPLSTAERFSLFANALKSKILTNRLSPGGIKVYPDKFLRVCSKTPIDVIVFIQNGIDFVERIGFDEALSRISAIQGYELNWRANPYVLTQSFFDPSFSLSSLSSGEEELLRSVMSRTREIYIVSSSKGEHYKFIEKLAGGKGMIVESPVRHMT